MGEYTENERQWMEAISKDSVNNWSQCLNYKMENNPKESYFIIFVPTYFVLDTSGIIMKSYNDSDSIINFIDSIPIL